MTLYTTWGPVRGGCGHAHRSLRRARGCLSLDRGRCEAQGGYSDREIRRIGSRSDLDGFDVTRGPGREVSP